MSGIEHCFANIISPGCAGFKYFPEAGKHALHPPPHLRGVPKTNSGAGARRRFFYAPKHVNMMTRYAI